MDKHIKFFDEQTNEEILFEMVNSFDLEGQRYVLVADEYDEATILKEIKMDNEEIIYQLIEDDAEFQKVALLFMESEGEYTLEY